MKNEQLKETKERRRLLFLPLVLLPFVTMAFWALGGGRGERELVTKERGGLNLQLPSAQLKDDRGENKLSFYQEADKDSLEWKRGMEEPFLGFSSVSDSVPAKGENYHPYPLQTEDYKDVNEQKVYQKLAELNRHLQNPQNDHSSKQASNMPSSSGGHSFGEEDVDRLEKMLKTVSAPQSKDPEVDQLTTMMDRILDIQHPERVKQKLPEKGPGVKEEVFPVKRSYNPYMISLLDTSKPAEEPNAFYGEDVMAVATGGNTMEAVIHGTQSISEGAIVKIRLLNDVSVGGTVISRGAFVFGKASFQGERLHIEIHSIRKDDSIYPVEIVVYDLDGMEGIYIPGALTREVAKQSADVSLQNIELASIDPSVKARAASAGINTAKSLLSKKVKLVKVMVKSGYKILLKEKGQ